MNNLIKKYIHKYLLSNNIKLIKYNEYTKLVETTSFQKAILDLITASQSQLSQDLFVLRETKAMRNGYFVEFGASDGIKLSNTYLLEKEYDWKGILVEPARTWHNELKKNRSAIIDTRCVWSTSGEQLEFSETDDAEYSTLSEYKDHDTHVKNRINSRNYLVETISLTDLLDTHKAPKTIDYLSIDTEGSEYEILKNFDFNKYKIRIITCEHNYTENRNKIYLFLKNMGYIRVLSNISDFDDWYIYNQS